MPKPRTAAGYAGGQVANVRATCLYLATKLGDLLDELVIVGGLVPTLLIDQAGADAEKHVGTLDLDVGMQVAILDNRRYEALTERLRAAGFGPDANEKGNQTRQRWRIDGPPRRTFRSPPSIAASSARTLFGIALGTSFQAACRRARSQLRSPSPRPPLPLHSPWAIFRSGMKARAPP